MNEQVEAAAPEVPDFDLIRPVGSGGFGQVWLATNRTTGRLRAVKVIPLAARRASRTRRRGRSVRSPGWKPIFAAAIRTCLRSTTWARRPATSST